MNMMSTNSEISNNMLKSNTSLVGIVCRDGIILGADRRGTAGTIVMEKAAQKINKINNYILAAYTGSVSDLQLTNKMLSAELRIKELKTKSRPTVEEAANLLAMMIYRNIRYPSMVPSIVGTLIAGVDEDGKSSLFSIEPAGSIKKVEDYDANFSSGMPYIIGLLERAYKKDISVKEGIELAKESIKSSTQRDIGSGNGIDVFSITREGIKHEVSEEIIPHFAPSK